MQVLKCLVSIVLGTLLGLFSSCVHSNRKVETTPATNKTGTKKPGEAQPPKKGEDLPVRVPILE